jgi:hypothetical protein
MSTIPRREVYIALEQALRERCPSFKKITRWRLIDPPDLPALTIRPREENPTAEEGHPLVMNLVAELLIFSRSLPNDGPEDSVFALVTEIEMALAEQTTLGETGGFPWTTLGGVVQRAWISGPVQYEIGAVSDVALVTVSMRCAAL